MGTRHGLKRPRQARGPESKRHCYKMILVSFRIAVKLLLVYFSYLNFTKLLNGSTV